MCSAVSAVTTSAAQRLTSLMELDPPLTSQPSALKGCHSLSLILLRLTLDLSSERGKRPWAFALSIKPPLFPLSAALHTAAAAALRSLHRLLRTLHEQRTLVEPSNAGDGKVSSRWSWLCSVRCDEDVKRLPSPCA